MQRPHSLIWMEFPSRDAKHFRDTQNLRWNGRSRKTASSLLFSPHDSRSSRRWRQHWCPREKWYTDGVMRDTASIRGDKTCNLSYESGPWTSISCEIKHIRAKCQIKFKPSHKWGDSCSKRKHQKVDYLSWSKCRCGLCVGGRRNNKGLRFREWLLRYSYNFRCWCF